MPESDVIRFWTEAGSQYEVDHDRGLIRRLRGSHPPTPRQGEDGKWQTYMAIGPVAVGMPVSIVWKFDLVDGVEIARSTITSRVLEVGPISEARPVRRPGGEP